MKLIDVIVTEDAYRYSYQPDGVAYSIPVLEATYYNTPEGARKLVARWNKRDKGKRVWTFEVCHADEIDHPSNRERMQRLFSRKVQKTVQMEKK